VYKTVEHRVYILVKFQILLGQGMARKREFEELSDLKPVSDEEFEELLDSMKDRRRRRKRR